MTRVATMLPTRVRCDPREYVMTEREAILIARSNARMTRLMAVYLDKSGEYQVTTARALELIQPRDRGPIIYITDGS